VPGSVVGGEFEPVGQVPQRETFGRSDQQPDDFPATLIGQSPELRKAIGAVRGGHGSFTNRTQGPGAAGFNCKADSLTGRGGWKLN